MKTFAKMTQKFRLEFFSPSVIIITIMIMCDSRPMLRRHQKLWGTKKSARPVCQFSGLAAPCRRFYWPFAVLVSEASSLGPSVRTRKWRPVRGGGDPTNSPFITKRERRSFVQWPLTNRRHLFSFFHQSTKHKKLRQKPYTVTTLGHGFRTHRKTDAMAKHRTQVSARGAQIGPAGRANQFWFEFQTFSRRSALSSVSGRRQIKTAVIVMVMGSAVCVFLQ